MPDVRKYGNAPFSVAVVHGGPGAPGHMAPVARRLSATRGVIEPLQTAVSVEGMVDELRTTLLEYADLPVVLIGSSWGAMLALLLAGRHPDLVRQLILVGSGSFDASYGPLTLQTRLDRLSLDDRIEVLELMNEIEAPDADPALFARLGELLGSVDTFEATDDIDESDALPEQPETYRKVWPEVERLRAEGVFLDLATLIECPVIAIHGDHDTHPAEGVRAPLADRVMDFRFILLRRCGHTPWNERHAREPFFTVLEECLEQVQL